DDILDITGDEEILGKPVGSDEESGKSTYVSILGVDEAKKSAKEITAEAVKSLAVFGEEAWFLEELAAKLLYREK
ncbi:MAG: polyprenyl synthetase family protein, partial [Clostridia bacterium]|nr:polyprenyl synthetase family protein [Clostridia bacterium]